MSSLETTSCIYLSKFKCLNKYKLKNGLNEYKIVGYVDLELWWMYKI